MRVYLECIPCFFRQALEGARNAGLPLKAQKQIMNEFSLLIPKISLRLTPPEIARMGYSILKKYTCAVDPYKQIKEKSNSLALRLLNRLEDKVGNSKDRLLTALELAIAGNIIDFGVKNNLNIIAELKKILSAESKSVGRKSIFHYTKFKGALRKAENILYLADNAGEVVFDRVLIEEIRRKYPEKNIYFAVKERPVINDALLEDAKVCGVDKIARIISNGTDAPGTILRLCSKEFKRVYNKADMIISKGQGNFESLSQEKRPIFFLFMVKCPVVEKETGCKIGDIILFHNCKKKVKK
ncbi:MAG: DUF89 family protein [Candidatus Omnitrophica bacterium]|nr:DUF89 family protein [Candidatus Omnitrophota bacterium]